MATPKQNADKSTGELVEFSDVPILSTTELNKLDTSEQNLFALIDEWGLTESDLIIGDAYPLADKDSLIDVPLFLVQWKFGTSQTFGAEYVQIKAVRLDTNERLGIFDSGVGIYGALNELTEQRYAEHKPPYNGAVIRKGLTKSEYPPKIDDHGQMVRPGGTTYYFG